MDMQQGTLTLHDAVRGQAAQAALPGEPAWLADKRKAGLEAWDRLAADPGAWGTRFVDKVRKAAGMRLEFGAAAALPAGGDDGRWGAVAARVRYTAAGAAVEASPELAAQGVRVMTLAEALKAEPGLLEANLFSRTRADECAASALHAALLGPGAVVRVPKGVRVERPVRLTALHDGAGAAFAPHTLLVLEPGAELTVVDELASLTGAAGFCAPVSELVLGEGSRLTYIHHQDLNRQSGMVMRQRTLLGRDSYLYTLSLGTGGAFSSSFVESVVESEGANVDLLGLVMARGGQEFELRTLQDHRARGGNSDALVKSILRGEARFWFDGVVRIRKAGQNTNAFQSNPNLMLSQGCRAESIPTLEIEADDVACKHAASIGGIDEEARFYLLSRGVPPAECENLITEGFAAEVAGRLPQGALQDAFVALLARLAREASAC